MSLKRKIFLILFLVGTISISAGVSVLYFLSVSNLSEQLNQHLKTIATEKARWVTSFFDKTKEDVSVIATALSARQILNVELNEKTLQAKEKIFGRGRPFWIFFVCLFFLFVFPLFHTCRFAISAKGGPAFGWRIIIYSRICTGYKAKERDFTRSIAYIIAH